MIVVPIIAFAIVGTVLRITAFYLFGSQDWERPEPRFERDSADYTLLYTVF
jgi:hypothetical protein